MTDFRQRFLDRVAAHRAAFQPPIARPADLGKVAGYDRDTGRFVLASRAGHSLRGSASSGAIPIGTQATRRQQHFDTLQPRPGAVQRRSTFIRRPGFTKIQAVFWIDRGGEIDWYLGGDVRQPRYLGSWPSAPVFMGLSNLGNGRYIVALADALTGNNTTGEFVSGARQLSSEAGQIWQRFDSVRYAQYLGGGFWAAYLRWNPQTPSPGVTTQDHAWSQLYLGNHTLSAIATRTTIVTNPSLVEQETTVDLTPFNATYLDKVWENRLSTYNYIYDSATETYGNSTSNYHETDLILVGADNTTAITLKADWDFVADFDNVAGTYNESGTAFGQPYSISIPPETISPAYSRYFLEFSGAASPIEIPSVPNTPPDFALYLANANLIGTTIYDVPNPNTALLAQLAISGNPIEIDYGERRLDTAPEIRNVKPGLIWPLVVGGVPFSGIYSFSFNPA